MTIIQCYAPTNDQKDSNKDEFYQQLQDVVDAILRHYIEIIMGDVNAQIGGSRSRFEIAATEIDHFAISPSWRITCLQDACSYSGADVGSDNYPAIAKLKVKT